MQLAHLSSRIATVFTNFKQKKSSGAHRQNVHADIFISRVKDVLHQLNG